MLSFAACNTIPNRELPPGPDDIPAISFTGLNGTRFSLFGTGDHASGHVLRYRTGDIVEIDREALAGSAAEDLRHGLVAELQVRLSER